MSSHKSTAKGCTAKAALADPKSLVRFADLLKLRSLAASTQAEYLRYVRKLAARVGRDPADLVAEWGQALGFGVRWNRLGLALSGYVVTPSTPNPKA